MDLKRIGPCEVTKVGISGQLFLRFDGLDFIASYSQVWPYQGGEGENVTRTN